LALAASPSGHCWQPAAPPAAAKNPAGHILQAAAPARAAKRPAAHAAHRSPRAAEAGRALPGAHGEQAPPPPNSKPAGHAHANALELPVAVPVCVPGGHGVHTPVPFQSL